MRKIFVIWGLFISSGLFAQLGYRYGDKFIHLIPSSTNRYFVHARNPESKLYLEQRSKKTYGQEYMTDAVYMVSGNSFLVSSKPLLLENDYLSALYQDTQGNPFYILPRIIIALKNGVQVDDVIKGYGEILTLDSVQRLKGMYTLNCNMSTAQDVLKIVAELDTIDNVEWCEPDMICKWESQNNNPLFSLQYYLQNSNSGHYDINVVPAWDVITGSSNITVAVIDQGVDSNHEDLSGNVLQGYTIGDATGYGQPKNASALCRKAHGVACAGIIGAKNNDKGILGIAYGVKILPVNIYPNQPYTYYENGEQKTNEGIASNSSDIAYAIQWAAERADILCCPWGGNSESSAVTSAINNAMTNGRNGKGCVVVASSGNYYSGDSTLLFPARIEGVISVGAIKRNGDVQGYSQRGSDLDLVAPSGACNLSGDVVTTDRMDTLGYNPSPSTGSDLTDQNYTQKFGGTSAACPQVAGVAALILSANPNLTVDEVRSILRNTARKLPDMNGQNRTDKYGYGLVDAYAAVLKTTLSISGPSVACDYETFSIPNLPTESIVNWTTSNNNIILRSGQSTGTALYQQIGNGLCTITAHVYVGTSEFSLTKTVWAGVPTAPQILYWPTNNKFNPNSFYGVSVQLSPEQGIIDYEWTLSGGTISGSATGSSVMFCTASSGFVDLIVRARNACGWGNMSMKSGRIDTNGGSIVTSSGDGRTVTVTMPEEGEYEIQLWSQTGLVTRVTTVSQQYSLNIESLPKGLYFVKVVKDGELVKQLKIAK